MKATIKDVASKAGVSVATVSMVVNEKADRISEATIDKVKKAIEELDYSPNRFAQMFKKGKTNLLALFVPDLKNSFYTEIAEIGMEKAKALGYYLALIGLPKNKQDAENLEKLMMSGEFAGILVVSRKFDKILLKTISQSKVPCVLLDESIELSENYSLITGDNEEGGKIAARHFLEKGHRKLACITGPDHTPNSMRRLSGFLKVLMDKGIYLEETNIIDGGYSLEGGYRAGKYLLGKDITGIFAFNDLIAIGCMKAYYEAGYKIPEDISIIGYDDIQISSYMYPKLTTINQNTKEIGIKGIKQLVKLIEGEQPTDVELAAPVLIKGDTVCDLTKK